MDTEIACTLLNQKMAENDEWRSALATYDNALKHKEQELADAKTENERLRGRLKEYVDLVMSLRKKFYIDAGEPKWQRYVDSLWEQVNRVVNPEEYEEATLEMTNGKLEE